MTLLGAVLRPARLALTPARLALRTFDDLHTLAEALRHGENPETLMWRLEQLQAEVNQLNRHAITVTGQAVELIRMAGTLDTVARRLHGEAEELSDTMEPVRHSLDRIDDMTGSMDSLADSMEPVIGAVERVGRVADRFSSRPHDEN